MATTEQYKDGGSASYSFSIEYIKAEDIKVSVDGTDLTYTATNPPAQTTEYTVNGSNVIFKQASVSGSTTGGVRIYRETALEAGDTVTFVAGSSIRASDLNANHKLVRFSSQEQNQQTVTADLRDDVITTAKILDLNVTRGKIANDAIDGTKIADDVINSEHYVAGSIDTEHIGNSQVTTDKIADNAVTLAKLAGGALPTDITVTSANIVDGTILNADVDSSAAIAGTKISPNFGSQNVSNTGTLSSGAHTVTGNITVSGTVDGRDVATDGSKLDGIESGATADQTAAEIRTLVESASDSNVFTDADHSKLNAIEASATADQTASEIKTLLQSDKLTANEIATGALDGRYFTETEVEDNFLRQDSSETIASGVTWSSTDSKVATTAAIDLRIIDLVDDVGGFVPIANETSFPATNPDINSPATGGTIVSVKAASTNLAPSGTTVTIANGRGTGNAVIITGVTATIPSGFGFLVETTSTDHTYAFHRLVPKATEVSTVAANATNIAAAGANVTSIDNFADRYQVSTSAPTDRPDSSSLNNGDLWFDSSSNKVMMVYDGSSGDGFSPITPNQSDLTNINIVAGQLTFTEDLGLITNAVNTGSGNNSVNTVAASIANVNTTAGSITNVNTVATNVANVNTVAGSITNVNNVGGSIADVNRYAAEYVIQSGTPSSPSAGDLWYNTTANNLNYYTGGAWVAISPGIAGLINDSNPALANHLDCNDKNLTEVGTVSGNNLQIDFGTIA